MGIVAIILAIMIGLGFVFALPAFFGQTGVYVGQAFIQFVNKMFALIAVALPILTIFVFFYIGIHKEKLEFVVFSAIYGVMVYLILLYTGIYSMIANKFYAAMCFHSSWLESAFTKVKDALVWLALFVIGAVNRVIDEGRKTWNNIKTIKKRLGGK